MSAIAGPPTGENRFIQFLKRDAEDLDDSGYGGWFGYGILVLLFIGFLVAAILVGINNTKHNNAMLIRQTERYNLDLPEYNLMRSKELTTLFIKFIIFPTLASVVLIYIVIGTIVEKYSKNGNRELRFPLGYLIGIGLSVMVLIILIAVYYVKAMKKLKPIQKAISELEDHVYRSCYVYTCKNPLDCDTSEKKRIGLMHLRLSNGGREPDRDEIDQVIKEAARIALKDSNAISGKTIRRVGYTLCMYKYLQKDLVNDKNLKRTYRKDVLKLFKWMALSRKPIGISGYMLADNPAEMVNPYDINQVVNTMWQFITPTKLDSQQIKRDIKDDLSKTRSLASNIRASDGWKPVYKLLLASILPYALLYIPVLLLLVIGLLMYKAQSRAVPKTIL